MHIGLIGGIGPAATEFYYRELVKRHKAAGRELELTITHASMDIYLGHLANDARETQAKLFLKHVEQLKAAGCEAAVVTSMAGHYCIEELIDISPIKIINAIPILDRYFAANGVRRIGLLGTDVVMGSRFYGGVTSAEIILPQGENFARVSDTYFALARTGICTDDQREYFFKMGQKMIDAGADAIVLAGTDLCLAFEGYEPGFPVIDSALVHVDAIFEASIGDDV